MNKKKVKLISLQMVIVLLLIMILMLIHININYVTENTLFLICWISFLSFVIQIRLLKTILGTYINPVVLFSIFLYMFSSGQVVLYAFSVDIGDFNIFNRLENDVLYHGIVYVMLAYAIYQVGVLLAIESKNVYIEFTTKTQKEDNYPVFLSGLIFFTIGFFPYLINILNSLVVVLTSGYSAYYRDGVRLNNSFIGLGYYIFTGLIFIVVGGQKKYKKWAVYFIILLSVLKLMSGDRGDAIVFIFTAYMLYNYFIKKSNPSILKTTLVLILSMSIVPIIGALRHSATNQATPDIWTIIHENNIVISTFSNLGGTFWPLGKIIEIFPMYHEYLWGGTYMISILLLIPSFLRIGYLSEVDKIYSSPAGWLMEYLNMTYGPGFTPFAESYMNFGWVGILFMGAFGFLVSKTLCIKVKNNKDVPLMLGLSILSFMFFALATRSSFNYIIAYFTRYVLIPFIIIKLIETRMKKR
ncbi:hypothetical protein CSV77_15160 [Sporosarcina sp. P16b]|uniref:O-antigen polysaccharide polymerase Wzy n=1 Tax=Sporosarcina sp. P16b TaxID=2048261 RepID=UPI000C16AA70|nr:O-antigen polysaccharide polymerase Wzy [Sporosarcina sp. P16b]PIC69188.1 hypothetical protein CSV77_15160 [Sporosarcina sp. P16b]